MVQRIENNTAPCTCKYCRYGEDIFITGDVIKIDPDVQHEDIDNVSQHERGSGDDYGFLVIRGNPVNTVLAYGDSFAFGYKGNTERGKTGEVLRGIFGNQVNVIANFKK